jgi:hypothetical protein
MTALGLRRQRYQHSIYLWGGQQLLQAGVPMVGPAGGGEPAGAAPMVPAGHRHAGQSPVLREWWRCRERSGGGQGAARGGAHPWMAGRIASTDSCDRLYTPLTKILSALARRGPK